MLLKFITVLVIIQGGFTQNCQLNATLMDKKWVYATKPTATSWDILHTDYIKDQTTLHLLCSTKTSSRELFCNHGVFEKRNITNQQAHTCSGRIRATTVLLRNETSCRLLNGDFYQVRYTLPGGTVIPLYDVCYNKLQEQPLYSQHKTHGSNLTASTYRRPPFSRGSVVSREREFSFTAANVYNTFARLLGSNQTYVPNNKTMILERGHLANSQDFATYDQMDETFKYVNVIPQFRGSNRRNWKRIENWINKLPSNNTYVKIVSGSFGVVNLKHSETHESVPMYLMSNGKNSIPLWLYKVVKYVKKCYVFITLNNDFNTDASFNTKFCAITACPNGLQFSNGTRENVAISYCCDYNYFVRYIGRHAVLC